MATILLQAAGGIAGGLLGGPFGTMAGRALGGLAGAAVDGALFGQTRRVEGPRLNDARFVGGDEGAGVARVYGTARVAGQIIWATRFEEAQSTERQGGKGGGGGGTEVTSYSYFGNVAIGLCEGPVAGIRRVWADGEELDLATVAFRLHKGGEEQEPDPLIEAKQGVGNAPAYRGLAYLVFERLALERWGNRLPQIACEVMRPVGELEEEVRGITIIPGANEHGLDPELVRETMGEGEDRLPNRNMVHGETDFAASIDELEGLCPRLERAALVVSWFGTDLRAGHCLIRPGVEVREREETVEWRAGGVDREGAHLVSRIEGSPAYGGTPNDAGVVRALRDLEGRGLKVTYYPFILMDVPQGNGLPDPYGGAEQAAFPWRGRMSLAVAEGLPGSGDGTAGARAEIEAFLGSAQAGDFRVEGGAVSYQGPAEWSYRRMVLHQAHLAGVAGVDAFVIGSEMRGLTRIRDGAGRFPFVEGLMRLAGEVKAILPGALVTYAADWSEYFGYQPADGSGDVFYNLDPLWAHPAIDVVGIDSYLPLADWRDEDWGDGGPDGAASPYDRASLEAGIAGGEHYDWYYASEADRRARVRTPITDGAGKPWVYRAKDLANWWANEHRERRGGAEVGGATAWVPEGKPVWFTELGCPAVDKGANQPNVFVDPKSSESFTPYFSDGSRDDLVQRRFLETQLRYWKGEEGNPRSAVYGGPMVDAGAIHVWTWDARPYPAFPLRADVWSDGSNWRLGHWLSGRLGAAPLDRLIARLLRDHGFADVDVSGVDAIAGGYVVANPGSARGELEELMRLFGVTVHASGGRLVFRSLRRAGAGRELGALADEEGPLVSLRRMQAGEVPEEVVVGFVDPLRDYQPATVGALAASHPHPRKELMDLPLALDEEQAGRVAGAWLRDGFAARETAAFSLGPGEVAVEPGDRVALEGHPGRWLVTRIETGLSRRVEARRLAETAPPAASREGEAPVPRPPAVASKPLVHFLDLPLGDGGVGGPCVAVFARPWLPYAVASSAGDDAFEARRQVGEPATVGRLLAALGPGPEGVVDCGNEMVVELRRGTLASVSRARLLAGANACAVMSGAGVWEVLQFEAAEEEAPMRFRLRGLLRAQNGTDDAMRAGAAEGAAFVLLDGAVTPLDMAADESGRALSWRVAPVGRALEDGAGSTRVEALGARALRPLSPVHLRAGFAGDGSVRLSWIRRTRIGGNGWDGLEVPLGEEMERYRVRVVDEGGRELRLDADAPVLDLSAQAQAAAFGGLPARLMVHVAQYGLATGAGTERSAAFARR